MSCCSSSAERIRNAADSRYPAISCRIADTSAALSRVSLTDSAAAAADSPQHPPAAAAAAAADDDDDDDEVLCDAGSFLTLRSVGAKPHTSVKC